MLLIDINDTLCATTLAINFDVICNCSELTLEEQKEEIRNITAIIDEDFSDSYEIKSYIEEQYKNFVPRTFMFKDVINALVAHLQDQYSFMYRGSVGKEKYFETGSYVCEQMHDRFLEYGLSPQEEFNISFYFDEITAKKIVGQFAELYTASERMARMACEIDFVEKIYLQTTSWNNFENNLNHSKIIPVDNINHLCQYRSVYLK